MTTIDEPVRELEPLAHSQRVSWLSTYNPGSALHVHASTWSRTAPESVRFAPDHIDPVYRVGQTQNDLRVLCERLVAEDKLPMSMIDLPDRIPKDLYPTTYMQGLILAWVVLELPQVLRGLALIEELRAIALSPLFQTSPWGGWVHATRLESGQFPPVQFTTWGSVASEKGNRRQRLVRGKGYTQIPPNNVVWKGFERQREALQELDLGLCVHAERGLILMLPIRMSRTYSAGRVMMLFNRIPALKVS
jgi:hypothetical protein